MIRLYVDYSEKEEVKRYGARWNPAERFWYYEGDVRSMEGVGRFVLSLPEHITILEGEEVRQYVREKADYILKEMLQ